MGAGSSPDDVVVRITTEDDTGPGLDQAASRAAAAAARVAQATTEAADAGVASGAAEVAAVDGVAAALAEVAAAATESAAVVTASEGEEADAILATVQAALIAAQAERERADFARLAREASTSAAAGSTDQGEAIAAAAAKASKAVAEMEAAATRGGRGFVRAGTEATLAIDELEKEIKKAEASGATLGDAPAAGLAKLRAGFDGATRQMVVAAKASKDIREELNSQAIAAGTAGAQVNNLTDVLRIFSPHAAEAAIKLLIYIEVLKLLAEQAAAAEPQIDHLLLTLGETPEHVAGFNQFIDKLKAGDIVGVARLYHDSLVDMFYALFNLETGAEHAERGLTRFTDRADAALIPLRLLSEFTVRFASEFEHAGVRSAAAATALGKQAEELAKKWKDSVGYVPPELEKIQRKLHEVTATAAADALAAGGIIETQQEETERFFKAIGVATSESVGTSLTALAAYVEGVKKAGGANEEQARLITASARQIEERIKTLPEAQRRGAEEVLVQLRSLQTGFANYVEQVGGKSRDQIQFDVDKLLGFAEEVERSGTVSVQQAAKVAEGIAQIRAAIRTLPPEQRTALNAQLAYLERLQNGFRQTADVIGAVFGIKAPAEIRQSTLEVEQLVRSMGSIGRVTKEQAELVQGSALKILQEIGKMPVAERAAVADQTAVLRDLVKTYGEVAAKRKSFAVDVEAIEKAATEGLKEFAVQAEQAADGVISKLRELEKAQSGKKGGGEDAAKLRTELADLESQPMLTTDQASRLNELRTLLSGAADGASDLTKEIGLLGDKLPDVSAGEADINGLLRQSLDFFGQHTEAWHKLGAAGQDAVKVQLSGLQEAQREGGATADVIEGAYGKIGDVLRTAGVDTDAFNLHLSEASDGSVNLSREFGLLDQDSRKLSDALDGLGRSSDPMVESQRKTQDAIRETDRVTLRWGEDHKAVITDGSKLLDGFNRKLGVTADAVKAVKDRVQELNGVDLGGKTP